MKIENKDFWGNDKIIHSQNKSVENTSDYEAYLYTKAADYFKDFYLPIKAAKIFGCGTGREIKGILRYLPIDSILATDISENMILIGKENVTSWNLQDKVTMKVADAVTFNAEENSFELATFMNNMLNYIKERKDRNTIFSKAFSILKPNGVLIGVVHNQVGTPQKTLYFLIRSILKPFLRSEPGNRTTGFYGYEVGGYYFTKKDLHKHLSESGFTKIEIISLSEYYKQKSVKYNRLKGYNNLIFFATK